MAFGTKWHRRHFSTRRDLKSASKVFGKIWQAHCSHTGGL